MDPFSGAIIACVFFIALVMALISCSRPLDCERCGVRACELLRGEDGYQLRCRACGHVEDIA